MTKEAEQLLAAALKSVGLRGSFEPQAIASKAGLNRNQAEAAARALSNAGVLVLGFDMAAQFSPDYRKKHAPAEVKAAREAKPAKDAKPNREAKLAARDGKTVRESKPGRDTKPTKDAKVARDAKPVKKGKTRV